MKFHPMKFYRKMLGPRIFWPPICYIIILGLSSFIIAKLCLMTKQIEHNITLESYGVRSKSLSEIKTTAGLLRPLNSSAINLARVLSSYLNGTELPFLAIQRKVAPTLFVALRTIPQLSQVSYIGLDGLLFSYYNDNDQTQAVYSNTSSFSRNWYTQPVNRDTGKLYGDAVSSNPMVTVNASWFREALNSTSGYSWLGNGWNKAHDILFLNAVAMDGRGVISLGFPAAVVIHHFSALDFHGGKFHLATVDGEVIVQSSLPDTQIVINNSTLLVQKLKHNGDPGGYAGNVSCKSDGDDDDELSYFHGKIKGRKYVFYCSTLEIAGVQTVYVMGYPYKGLLSLVRRNSKLSVLLLGLMFISVVISLCVFIYFIVKAAKREMFLCAALIKQMEATQQAERKSMNKSFAFSSANHDVRASLAAITGLIELCHQHVNPNSQLAANLAQINTCTEDLLGILNSVLDIEKIEAGKMQLEEEEFDLAQLLEDVVDMFYPLGMKKGVDVVLDMCDGSILKSSLVRGDRVKLKQILCNLLSNAVKFTSEGHVVVSAMVQKTSFKNAIITSNRNVVLKCLSRLFYKNKEGFNDLDALHTAQAYPDKMEFVFEVDDTGKGIPKDERKSVFENFVQVKDTALGHDGCGLGLGIVQSLVRLMEGEIGIVDKEPNKTGTCFKFNIFLPICETESADTEESSPRMHSSPNGFQHFGIHIRGPSPKPEVSHVVLLIAGRERARILKKLIENFNIKVSFLWPEKGLSLELERLKRKLYFSNSSSFGKTDPALHEYLTKSASTSSDSGPHDASLSIKDGNDHGVPHYRSTNSKRQPSFILVVIDSSAGHFSELSSVVACFRKGIQYPQIKVVWLENSIMRNTHWREAEEVNSLCDHIIYKPFHGSRLYQVLGLLPELKGTYPFTLPNLIMKTTALEVQHPTNPHPSIELNYAELELVSSSHHKLKQKVVNTCDEQNSDKPLNGKKILVVDDFEVLRKVTSASLRKLGANVDICENGKEAFELVCKLLSEEGHANTLVYDYIFMDCEMPIMNGYEATRRIRMEEERYGVHTPIIALTAHAMAEKVRKTSDAGMDFHLTKPLQVGKLLDVIRSIDK